MDPDKSESKRYRKVEIEGFFMFLLHTRSESTGVQVRFLLGFLNFLEANVSNTSNLRSQAAVGRAPNQLFALSVLLLPLSPKNAMYRDVIMLIRRYAN